MTWARAIRIAGYAVGIFLLGANIATAIWTVFSLAHIFSVSSLVDPDLGVYPISGQYQLLPRLLYYTLLVFAAVISRRSWLVAGALATAMTYSGSAAIHAIVLLPVNVNGPGWDLDVLAIWAILIAGLVAVVPVLRPSGTLYNSQYAPIIWSWAILMFIALFFCNLSPFFHPGKRHPGFWRHQALRGHVPRLFPIKKYYRGPFKYMTLASLLVSFFSGICLCLIAIRVARSTAKRPSKLRIILRKINVTNFFGHGRVRGYLSKVKPLVSISAILFPTVIVLCEYALNAGSPSLPTSEPYYSVGQWSPFVNVALVLFAAALNHYYEPKWKAKQVHGNGDKDETIQLNVVQQQSVSMDDKIRVDAGDNEHELNPTFFTEDNRQGQIRVHNSSNQGGNIEPHPVENIIRHNTSDLELGTRSP